MTKFQRTGILSGASTFALCLAAGLSANPASAQSFTVPSGTTVTTTQTMNGPGATGTVEAGGAIETVNGFEYAVESFGDDALIKNNGEISTSGFQAEAIRHTGADVVIENSGTISTSGDLANAINSTGNGAVITNSGTVSTSGSQSDAVHASGDNAVVKNTGTITTDGDSAVGIDTFGFGVVITNDGTISTTDTQADAIHSTGGDAVITNNGSISVMGAVSYGIASSTNDNSVIINNGTISATGSNGRGIRSSDSSDVMIVNNGTISIENGSRGILSLGDTRAQIINNGTISSSTDSSPGIYSAGLESTVTNNGTIVTTGDGANGIVSVDTDGVVINRGVIRATGISSFAIAMIGVNPDLRLLQGSVVEGDILFTQAAGASLHIGPGLSTALSIDISSGDFPGTITASGMPLVVDAVAGTVAVADVTALRVQSEMLGDLTGGIFSAIGGRQGGDAATTPLAYAPVSAAASITDIYRSGGVPTREAWLKGFGGYRRNDGTDSSAENDQALAGLVSGVDLFSSEAGVAGIFVGGSWGEVDVAHSQDLEAVSGFGGVYGTFGLGSATLDVALAAGFSSYDSERYVNNNLAPGGIETAEADYDGWFVSPHLALTQPFVIGGHIVEAKASVRYAGLFLDGYDETGSSANLSVDDRDVHLFVGRAGLGLPIDYTHDNGALTRITPQIGIEGRAQFGDTDASGSLAGVAIDFSADGEDAVGGYAGVLVEHQAGENLTLFMETEGLIEEDAGRFFGKAGARLRF